VNGVFIHAQGRIELDDDLNKNNATPYYSYGSKISPIGNAHKTDLGFMSIYYIHTMKVRGIQRKDVKGGIIQVNVVRETIGAVASKGFKIDIYETDPK
jgi:hypothetical protein